MSAQLLADRLQEILVSDRAARELTLTRGFANLLLQALRAQGEPVAWLCQSDMAALVEFHSCVCDGDGYMQTKDEMRRLAEIGVVQSKGFGKYCLTSFGANIVESHLRQKGDLPLKTMDDYNKARMLPAPPTERAK